MTKIISSSSTYSDEALVQVLGFTDVEHVRGWIEKHQVPYFRRSGKWWVMGAVLQSVMFDVGRDQAMNDRRPPQANSKQARRLQEELDRLEVADPEINETAGELRAIDDLLRKLREAKADAYARRAEIYQRILSAQN